MAATGATVSWAMQKSSTSLGREAYASSADGLGRTKKSSASWFSTREAKLLMKNDMDTSHINISYAI